jgi:hypothetical protein
VFLHDMMKESKGSRCLRTMNLLSSAKNNRRPIIVSLQLAVQHVLSITRVSIPSILKKEGTDDADY